MTVVWNQHGAEAHRRITDALPDLVVVDVPLDPATTPSPIADVLFATGRYPSPTAAWATGIRWVHAGSSGVETLPAELLAADIVTCSRGIRSDAIAEFVLAAMLSAVKDMPRIWAANAVASDFSLGTLTGATLGLIGVGTIGQAIARRAAAFDLTVLGTRRSANTGHLGPVELVALQELLERSDHVVVAAPATEQSRNMLDSAAFDVIKPGAHLVNVSRGALVDHDALLTALDSGRVALASLDVTEPEPLPADHPLRLHPHVRLSPHVCFMDGDPAKVIDFFIENLKRYEAGKPLNGVVNVGAGY
jgi:phosphoglycerate dehydrogenase-like enzyme